MGSNTCMSTFILLIFLFFRPTRRHVVLMVAFYVAFSQDILHRDIKPENTMIGYDGVPKLIDFGMATRLENETRWGYCGSPGFIAPEVERNHPKHGLQLKPYGKPADVYSLGALVVDVPDEADMLKLRNKVNKN